MKFVTRFIAAVSMSAAAMLLQAKELPQSEVCVQMEEAGERLLSGKLGDFYFVEVGSTAFPVPSFFVIRPPSRSGKSAVKIAARPLLANSRSANIRRSGNPCEWSLTALIGPIDGMYEQAGGEEKFRKMQRASYQVGHMKVSLLRTTGMSTDMVVARDESGYIVFFTENPEQTYWLINLAAKLSEGDSE